MAQTIRGIHGAFRTGRPAVRLLGPPLKMLFYKLKIVILWKQLVLQPIVIFWSALAVSLQGACLVLAITCIVQVEPAVLDALESHFSDRSNPPTSAGRARLGQIAQWVFTVGLRFWIADRRTNSSRARSNAQFQWPVTAAGPSLFAWPYCLIEIFD